MAIPLAGTVRAAANASPGTVTTYVTVFNAQVATTVEWKVSNPLTNGYNIIEFLVNAGGGGAVTGAFGGCFSSSVANPALAGDANWQVTYPNAQEVNFQWITTGVHTPLSPGSYEYFICKAPGFTSVAQSGAVNADTYTQSYLTQDSTLSGVVPAGTATIYVAAHDATISWISQTLTPTVQPLPASNTNLIAGTSVLDVFQITSTLTPGLGVGGIPVSFTWGSADLTYNASGLATLTPSGVTSSTGTVSSTFYLDPVIADQPTGAWVIATAGATPEAPAASGTITTTSPTYRVDVSAVPSALSISLCQFGTCYANSATATPLPETGPLSAIVGATTDNCATTGICVFLTDIYGNPAPAPSKISVTLGVVNVAGSTAGFSTSAAYSGVYPYTPTHPITISLTVTILTGHVYTTTGTYNFFYGVDFGDTSYLTATASGLPVATSVSVLTNTIDISTAGETFAYSLKPVAGVVYVQAGSTVTVSYILLNVQANVPVNFTLTGTHPALTYSGLFSNGEASIVELTNSSGIASAVLTVDTDANLPASTHVIVRVNQTATSYLAAPLTSDKIVTIAGPIANLFFVVSYAADFTNSAEVTSLAVNGTKLYVDVILTDAYNNTVPNPGPSQILVTLVSSAGALSSGSPTIPAKCEDLTNTSPPLPTAPVAGCTPFGAVTLLTPTTVGTAVQITASTTLPALSNSITITTVSSLPMLTVISPTPSATGTIYSKYLTVTFSGVANASLGYAHMGVNKVTLVSLGYSVNGSTWKSHPLTGSDTAWSVAMAFNPGLSTVQFNVTDSLGNVYVAPAMNVLVDSNAPKIGFTTTTGSTASYGTPVTAWAYDLYGDFNTSSVVVTANGVALPAADIAVTGANTLGSNSSFAISITGLAAGTWTLSMTASTYAGVTAAAVSIKVVVTVAFADSVAVTAPTQTTIGSFTGVSATLMNGWTSSQNVIMFAVFTSVTTGQVACVATGSATLASSASESVFAPCASLPTGSYSVAIFVITTGNNPVSTKTTISVTV